MLFNKYKKTIGLIITIKPNFSMEGLGPRAEKSGGGFLLLNR